MGDLRAPGDPSRSEDAAGAPPRPSSPAPGPPPSPPPYRVEVLRDPELGPDGIEHGGAGGRRCLAWNAVAAAVAAEVGEPQGVRAIVFDLVCREGDGWAAARLDAEPGEEASQLARALDTALGDAARPSIKSLATDGIPTRWYPDLESFEEGTRRELGGAG